MNDHPLRLRRIGPICLLALMVLPTIASADEEVTYKFERMWPTLQQPWYFYAPDGAAVDDEGYLYLADSSNYRIVKLTTTGQLVTHWGGLGEGDGQFGYDTLLHYSRGPTSIDVDDNGYVYAVDMPNRRIQKFTVDGQFVLKWSMRKTVTDIAAGPGGVVYVALYRDANCIMKYTSAGELIAEWPSPVVEWEYPFRDILYVEVDASGNVYLSEGDGYIYKFSPDGEQLARWGGFGDGPEQFVLTSAGRSFGMDAMGVFYVADLPTGERGAWNYVIKKFTSSGEFIETWVLPASQEYHSGINPPPVSVDRSGTVYIVGDDGITKCGGDGQLVEKWGPCGTEAGRFHAPSGLAMDEQSNIYVADYQNQRVQKFTRDGQYITQWGSYGTAAGQFRWPIDVAVDASGAVYVVDSFNERVQKFGSDGQYVTEWTVGSQPACIVVDKDGNVYVKHVHHVAKYSSDGMFIQNWVVFGAGEYATGIATDAMGNVYVGFWTVHEIGIQLITPDGEVHPWGSAGTLQDLLTRSSRIGAIAVDDSFNVYLGDGVNHRIIKLTQDGEFITMWGTHGFGPGQMVAPADILVNSWGDVYVNDIQNHRIQVFRQISISQNSKAVIVAGGGPFPGNGLWDATQMCANFAYRALIYQGFTKQTICYLTSDLDLDLDSNGEYDDVDGDATSANLQQAITEWAADADSLVVYLVDHGGEVTFRMSGTETLSGLDLDAWLDQLQATMPGKVTVIYDACESGSFVLSLTPPAGKERLVIASTSPGESAYFVTLGSVSFSNFFWTEVFNGLDLAGAFSFASDAIGQAVGLQNPLVDANGNGTGNEAEDLTLLQGVFIGNGTDLHEDRPAIGSVSAPQTIEGTNSATLWAFNVTDEDGIGRVWAVIRPPDYRQGAPGNPVLQLPSTELWPGGGANYEATYDGFSKLGTYHIAIYAKDAIGNTSLPGLTMVSVTSPLRRKAIIVAGGSISDSLWPTIECTARLAYEALSSQGYDDDDIYYLSQTGTPGVDVLGVLSNIEWACTSWGEDNTQDFSVYLVGPGENGAFVVNDTERLAATQLDTWLDDLQAVIPGKVTVIYDACRSGSFLSALAPPTGKERIVISSTGADEPACFLSGGDISFSKYFWTRVLNGTSVGYSFMYARDAISCSSNDQTPSLDDNGNGIGNEKGEDGKLARYYIIGVGIMLAGDDPLIGSICPEQTLYGEPSATIWAEDVTTTGSIDTVWAVITPPGYSTGDASVPVTDLPTLELSHLGDNRYEGTYDEFFSSGTYHVAVYATDQDGNVSMPQETAVHQTADLDAYENDDTWDEASWTGVDGTTQDHSFHDYADMDWLRFCAIDGTAYVIDTLNLGPNCDTVLTLFDTDGMTQLAENDDHFVDPDSHIEWTASADGIYFVRVRHANPGVYGEGCGYEVKVWTETGPFLPGALAGTVKNAATSMPIPGADVVITSLGNLSSRTGQRGEYVFSALDAGTYSLTASADGYQDESAEAEVTAGGLTEVHLELTLEQPANQAPVCFAIDPISFDEDGSDTSIDLDDYVSDVDNTDAELSWAYSWGTNISVSIVPVSHIVTLGAAANWYGTETITFTCTDPGGLSDSTQVEVTVAPGNDGPGCTGMPAVSFDEDGNDASINLDDYVSDVDNTDAELSWTYSGATNVTVSIDPVSHVASLGAAANWYGAETVTFTCTDPGGLSDSTQVPVTVEAVNDAPVCVLIGLVQFDEDGSDTSIDLDDYVSDVDNADAELSWTHSGAANVTVSIDPTTHVVTLGAAEDWYGEETITFTCTDPGGLSDSSQVEVTVAPVNDADVNRDDNVNAIDVQLVINEALGISTGFDCDLNGDGQVNAIDVQLVINTTLGIGG